jgi:hypothetical protein
MPAGRCGDPLNRARESKHQGSRHALHLRTNALFVKRSRTGRGAHCPAGPAIRPAPASDFTPGGLGSAPPPALALTSAHAPPRRVPGGLSAGAGRFHNMNIQNFYFAYFACFGAKRDLDGSHKVRGREGERAARGRRGGRGGVEQRHLGAENLPEPPRRPHLRPVAGEHPLPPRRHARTSARPRPRPLWRKVYRRRARRSRQARAAAGVRGPRRRTCGGTA